ncbi:MAG: hypothetical protein HND48_15465 [Chloroflexi bacterium]|nr:hypothetical protein [Chloroflexota bacterium]
MSDPEDKNESWIPFLTVNVPPRFVIRTMRPASAYAASLFGKQPDPDALVIDVVEHGVFGSGAHPTTQLCLTLLADMVRPESRVLDLGCGRASWGLARRVSAQRACRPWISSRPPSCIVKTTPSATPSQIEWTSGSAASTPPTARST